ncbi:tRNA (adenine(22)-N(1))-methyltransferase TrmK [Terribacillus sp. DMT04]|uniref:tRNA (adenine(22)-N(1))-methyltransferase n=1 Tax=Terribacillus sp. DMT04 TaxID=2850441 RepID=UPI001C2CC001|nr:tRNA (adenine(22)-N(1))-methyltransferase TrmK [Terribacillus sp. DMT04]QXE00449.1 tRNA (adenine(22)-N(1))-methyltransferase TrmK [Terribacillus sp. DMT04]
MNVLSLSERLTAVAAHLPESAHFVDVGSDHAYLPCYVCLQDPSSRAIAGEINHGPYKSAEKQVKLQGLTDRIEVRKGDGLAVVEPNEVKQVVIAGMGGPLIASILEQGKDKLGQVEQLIVQPNIDARVLRKWFLANGFVLQTEEILEEAGHIYEVLVAVRAGKELYDEDAIIRDKQLLFGPQLLQEKNAAFRAKWQEYKRKLERNVANMQRAQQVDEAKLASFKTELIWLEEELDD